MSETISESRAAAVLGLVWSHPATRERAGIVLARHPLAGAIRGRGRQGGPAMGEVMWAELEELVPASQGWLG